jgi:alkylhydroperoxidase family enzyme
MARISLNPPNTLLNRIAHRFSRRRFGRTIEPNLAAGHNARVMATFGALELGVERWKALDPDLSALAVMVSASTIGCSWCMDFGYWENHHRGMDVAKLRDVPQWRTSTAYTELERMAMAYAEAMTATPPEVTDEMVGDLLAELGEPALVELTAVIAVENLRGRNNLALGLTSQGFKDSCEVTTR